MNRNVPHCQWQSCATLQLHHKCRLDIPDAHQLVSWRFATWLWAIQKPSQLLSSAGSSRCCEFNWWENISLLCWMEWELHWLVVKRCLQQGSTSQVDSQPTVSIQCINWMLWHHLSCLVWLHQSKWISALHQPPFEHWLRIADSVRWSSVLCCPHSLVCECNTTNHQLRQHTHGTFQRLRIFCSI